MKADIHPDYHEITVVMTDGTQYKTRSTYGKEGDTLNLDIDPLTHPAWQGGTGRVVEKGQLDKFEGRYGTFLSGSDNNKQKSAAPEKQEAAKEEVKKEEAPAETADPAEIKAAAEEGAEVKAEEKGEDAKSE